MLLALLLTSSLATAQEGYIGIGTTFHKTDIPQLEIGAIVDGWEASLFMAREKEVDRNPYGLSIGKRFDLLKTHPLDIYGLFGASYINGSELVTNYNFKLGLAFRVTKHIEIAVTHHSNADTNKTNDGYDVITIRSVF